MQTLPLSAAAPTPPLGVRPATVLDLGLFDPSTDLRGWFLGEHLVERAAAQPDVQARLFDHYGLKGDSHFRDVQVAVAAYLRTPHALATWGDEPAVARIKASALLDAPAPVPLERYLEIVEAQRAAAQRGLDAREVLAHFGLNDVAWSHVRFWWLERLTRSVAENDAELHARFARIQAHFRQKYGT